MLLSRNRLGILIVLVLIIAILYNLERRYLSNGVRLGFASLRSQPSDLAYTLSPQEHVYRAPKTIHHIWKITTGFRAPDGVRKRVYLINGHFPGPWIEARSGDDIVIEVVNDLVDEGVAIHWHGLWMRGANEMDGAVGLTQCPISPSKIFTYKFHVDEKQAGSFWYHSHSELQRADGLYGGIVIHKPTGPISSGASEGQMYNHDEDLGLLIGDWYHRPSHEIQDYYADFANAGNEPAPDSLVINGNGFFNCSMAVPARPLACQSIAIPQLTLSGNRTRLRLVNTGAMAGFTISITGYSMHLIQVDGGGEVVDSNDAAFVGIVYPGERVDIIVERIPWHEESKSAIMIELDPENLGFRNFALTETQIFPIVPASGKTSKISTPNADSKPAKALDLAKVIGLSSLNTGMPEIASESLVLYTKIEILGEFNNTPRGFINQTTWQLKNHEYSPLLASDRIKWGNAFVPYIEYGSDRWVDIVLNNFDDKGHPFHLHGNDFFILSVHQAGIGGYDEAFSPFDTSKPPAGGPLNIGNPVRKDTVFVPAMGYAVLRFKANNEGLWFFHCHILWHQAAGMAMAFHVGDDVAGFRIGTVTLNDMSVCP